MATKNPFVRDLEEIERSFETMSNGQEVGRTMEYALNSAAWKLLKEIKRPEDEGGWPVDTGVSRAKWGFERVRRGNGKVTFVLFNDAPALRGRLKGHAYAGWVYAKGDGLLRRPIAPGIIKRAIIAATPEIEKNFYERLNKYFTRRGSK